MHDHQVGGKSLEDINAKLSFNVVGIGALSTSVANLLKRMCGWEILWISKDKSAEHPLLCSEHWSFS